MERPAPAVVARHRTHVARIYPTPAQAVVLDRQGRTARALWNLLHEWYICRNGGIARRPSVAEIDRQLRAARTDPLPGWEWLAELPAQATQQVLKNYLRTWNRFYEGSANPPKPKKGNGRLGVDVPQASQLRVTRLGRRWSEVTIPSAGRIRFRWTRSLPGCLPRVSGPDHRRTANQGSAWLAPVLPYRGGSYRGGREHLPAGRRRPRRSAYLGPIRWAESGHAAAAAP
jgi:hypothetical protein